MLSAKDLRITFNAGTPIETRALRGLSLEIPSGQFVTVIGSNGAGKSTFLNAVSGDLSVDTGNISIFAGCDRVTFDMVFPLLTILGRRILHTQGRDCRRDCQGRGRGS